MENAIKRFILPALAILLAIVMLVMLQKLEAVESQAHPYLLDPGSNSHELASVKGTIDLNSKRKHHQRSYFI